MAQILRQSTAVDVLIGPMVDEDDGKTLEESLTISQGDVMLSKNGQALAQKNDVTACAFDDLGCYNCELDATDTNTVGTLTLVVFEDGALLFRRDYQVVEEAIYDAMFAASATGATPAISDLDSALVVVESSIDSDQVSRATAISDVKSQLTVVQAKASDTHSRLVVVEASIDSDQTSRATAISDLDSALVVVEAAIDSDQVSRTAAISDVKSRLVVVEASIDSDQLSRATAISDVKSQLTVVQAKASDTHSRLVVVEDAVDSDQVSRTAAISDVKSRLVVVESAIDSDTASAATIVASMASSVEAIEAGGGALTAAQASQLAQAHSDLLAADIVSAASSIEAIEAGGGALTAAQASQLAQAHSDILAADIVSAASSIEAIEAKASDTHSRLVVVEASIDSDQVSRATAISDVKSALTIAASDAALLEASHAEPTGVPSATASPLTKLGTVYMMLRNKVTVTATKKTFYDDGDAAEFEQDLSDDGTTFQQSEVNAP